MRMKRTIGLSLSLALAILPATTAVAKPVASHHLDMTWSEAAGGVIVNGGFDLSVDDAGVATVDLLSTELRLETCEDGSVGAWQSSLRFRGVATLETVIDRQLDSIEVRGTLQADRTVTSFCDGVSVKSEAVEVGLSGVSVDRPVRTRDRVSGTRYISRAQEIVLDFGEGVVNSAALLTKSISQA